LFDENIELVPKSNKLGEAFRYAKNEWVYVIRYLDDGRFPMGRVV